MSKTDTRELSKEQFEKPEWSEQQQALLEEAENMWKDLKITNDFLFSKMLENPVICKRLLEVILEVEIERIEYPQAQKTIRMQLDGKGVRLDVYVADENHTVYNIEMQATNTHELPLRSRYYQGIIDMDIIAKGKDYDTLHKSYVIFICTFDLFEKGLYKYTFENRCIEDNEIALGDKTQKIFLNAKGILDDVDEELRAFLKYVDGNESDNEFVQLLKDEAIKVKGNENWRRDFMMQHVRDRLKFNEGIEQGRVEERVAIIRTKVQKSKSLSVIADELECEVEGIRHIYDVITECGAGCSVEEIMEKLKE